MLKNLAYLLLIAFGLSSCHALKPIADKPFITSEKEKASLSPEFIQTVHIIPSPSNKAIKTGGTAKSEESESYSIDNFSEISAIESFLPLQFKYSVLLNVAVERLTNLKLLGTIEEWYGTKYRYGGTTKAGIDCSAFACALMTTAFGLSLPRTSKDQYNTSRRIDRSDLQEGDLVFFNTRGGISHVGVYINNNKFVHASTSSGVMISDLGEDYYWHRYVGAGRVL